jgi:MFS family permease
MTTTARTSPAVAGAHDTGPRWLMLVVLLAGQFMALIDVTITNVAIPTIGRSLHASGAELQLVVAGYLVSYAMLLITGARLGDVLGRRRVFLLGVGLFTLASLACGLAPDAGVLIAARFVQGAGAAAMVPQIMSVIQVRFTGAARVRALSAYTAVLSSGFVVGQVVGGALVTANLFGTGWRPVFLVNVPLGLAVLALAPRLVPGDAPSGRRRLDLRGLSVAVPAVFLVVLPLMIGHQERWPGWTFACMAIGCALAVVFVIIERAVAAAGGDPLLRLSVLRSPGLPAGLAATLLLLIPYGGFLFGFAIHLQAGLGFDALHAGLVFAPSAVAFGLCGYFWRRLPARLHPFLTPAGCVLGAVGYLGIAATLRSGGTGGLALQAWLIADAAGLALAFSPLVAHALVRVPLTSAADASGLLTTAMQLGQAVGVAAFGSLFLTLDSRAGRPAAVSGHAISVTLAWAALVTAVAVLAVVPLTRTVLAARRASTAPPRLPPISVAAGQS